MDAVCARSTVTEVASGDNGDYAWPKVPDSNVVAANRLNHRGRVSLIAAIAGIGIVNTRTIVGPRTAIRVVLDETSSPLRSCCRASRVSTIDRDVIVPT